MEHDSRWAESVDAVGIRIDSLRTRFARPAPSTVQWVTKSTTGCEAPTALRRSCVDRTHALVKLHVPTARYSCSLVRQECVQRAARTHLSWPV